MRPAYDPASEDIFFVTGDKDTGVSTTADMTAGSIKVQLRYNGKYGNYVATVDVYDIPGIECSVVLICPKCHHSLRITSARKSVEWDPGKGLNVSVSECTWETGDRNDERMSFGINLCRFRFAIDGVFIKDA